MLTPAEAARLVGLSRSKMYELLAAGHVESVHIGRARRVPVAALIAYVDRPRAQGAAA